MASLSWTSHIEAFVNPDKSAQEQATSLDAIASLVLGDQLTLQLVVVQMEAYLTTTDNAVRARAILLLAEILTCLKTKPLEDTSIHSLTSFFTSRLADWQALRGAVIGCLALLKRNSDVGLVSASDARKLAESYLQNLQVQALAQQDRMLCFELLECLLDVYADAVSPLGDDLVFGVCAAIDEERDSRCLFLAFHIVELLVRLFSDADGPIASCTEDLFDIISRYFPILYTPPPNVSLGITREDLSRALMGCFMSSSLFAPFCIPLLLEKLSSSLQIAKVDALKYLGKCAIAYGVDTIAGQASAIWAALKNVIFNSVGSVSEVTSSMSLGENEVLEAALTCLTECILAYHKGNDTGVLLQLVLEDEYLEGVFRSVTSDVSAKQTPSNEKLRFQVQRLGCLLSASAKASCSCCSAVSQRFLPRLLDAMGGPLERGPDLTWDLNGRSIHNFSVNFGALSLCLEILEANRALAEHLALQSEFSVEPHAEDSWLSLLRCLSCPLTVVFASAIATHNGTDFQELLPSTRNEILRLGVTGLQALAAFPGRFSPLPEDEYKHVLLFLVSFILKRHNDVFLWEQVLGALVKISISLEKFNDSKRALCFQHIVIEELLSQLFADETLLPISLNLKAVIATCNSSFAAMTQVLQGFQKVLSKNFLRACVKGDGDNAMKLVVNVLDCLSSSVLPWCIKMDLNEATVQLALGIWSCVEEITTFDVHPPGQLLEAIMAVMRVSVQRCTEELQKMVLLKACDILSPQLSSLFGTSKAMNTPAQEDNFNTDANSTDKSNQGKWKIALFSSVVVALRPKIVIHYERQILDMFMNAILSSQGDNLVKDAAAQALGSMINKWPVAVDTDETQNILTLEDAIYIILEESLLRIAGKHGAHGQSEMVDSGTCSLRFDGFNTKDTIGVQIQAVTAVAWIGKGLAMRGHNKISDVAVLLLNVLRSSRALHIMSSEDVDTTMDLKSQVAQAAADGLGIIMKDSRTSLNKDCHAVIRPLYKQRFFSSMIPILILAIREAGTSFSRIMLYRALGHLISNAPHVALIAESKKLLPFILDGILVLSSDAMNKDLVQSLLLALSGILMDENNGRALVVEHISTIVNCLVEVIKYPYSVTVRETALQCIGTMIDLPHARIFPVRTQVLKAVSKALDDRKRSVRKEAVRCHHAWASIASRTSIY